MPFFVRRSSTVHFCVILFFGRLIVYGEDGDDDDDDDGFPGCDLFRSYFCKKLFLMACLVKVSKHSKFVYSM